MDLQGSSHLCYLSHSTIFYYDMFLLSSISPFVFQSVNGMSSYHFDSFIAINKAMFSFSSGESPSPSNTSATKAK